MNAAKITFSNNETLIIREGDMFMPISAIKIDNDISSALGKPCEIWSHTHDGLIPSLTELFYRGAFFCHVDDQNLVYSTSSIVKIENI